VYWIRGEHVTGGDLGKTCVLNDGKTKNSNKSQ